MLSILLTLIPALGSLVANGKTADVIAAGAKVAKELLGTDDPFHVAEELKDPKLAEAFKARLEAETAQLQAQLADLQDARASTVQLAAAGSPLAWGPVVLSALVLLGFIGISVALLFRQIADNQVTMVLFGQLAAGFIQVLNFWLGSSQGSREKDAHMAAMLAPPSLAQKVVKAIAK